MSFDFQIQNKKQSRSKDFENYSLLCLWIEIKSASLYALIVGIF